MANKTIVSNQIENKIFTIRNTQVMLDRDLAKLYGVETKVFNQAVKRNINRFPEDFRFQLTKEEFENLRSQFVTSSSDHGGRRYLPYVFTEQGVFFSSLRAQQSTLNGLPHFACSDGFIMLIIDTTQKDNN